MARFTVDTTAEIGTFDNEEEAREFWISLSVTQRMSYLVEALELTKHTD